MRRSETFRGGCKKTTKKQRGENPPNPPTPPDSETTRSLCTVRAVACVLRLESSPVILKRVQLALLSGDGHGFRGVLVPALRGMGPRSPRRGLDSPSTAKEIPCVEAISRQILRPPQERPPGIQTRQTRVVDCSTKVGPHDSLLKSRGELLEQAKVVCWSLQTCGCDQRAENLTSQPWTSSSTQTNRIMLPKATVVRPLGFALP